MTEMNSPEPSIRGTSSSSCSMGRTLSLAGESELDTDDYNDLTMTDCYKRPSTVKFSDQNAEMSSNANDLTMMDTEQAASTAEARRFVKSPHPRGSARFACRPLANNQEFIDAIVDPKACLENAMLSTAEELQPTLQKQQTTTASSFEQDDPESPPMLPPRSSPAPSAAVVSSKQPNTPQQQTPLEAPRPKPRISKMNSQNAIVTPEKGENPNVLAKQQR